MVNFKINNSKLYPIFILILGFSICVLMIIFKPIAIPDPISISIPKVDVQKVKKFNEKIIVKSQGTIIPHIESNIFSEIIGPVTYVSSKLYEGSSFKKGDTLAKIDSKDYELAIKIAESTLAAAKTKLSYEKAESRSAEKEWNKIGQGKPSDLTLRKPQLKQAKTELESAEANLERLIRNRNKTIIKAPYDGLVRKKYIDIGTVVSPGFLLANLYSLDYFEVKLPIPDDELKFIDIPLDGRRINTNNQPKILLKGLFGGEELVWEGTIVRMEAEIDLKTRMILLIGRISNPYESNNNIPLRVGQFVEAEIIGKEFDNIFKINRKLIKNNNQVILVNPIDSTLQYKFVNILKYIDEEVYVREGLVVNDLLCITNLDVMYDGMKVKIK